MLQHRRLDEHTTGLWRRPTNTDTYFWIRICALDHILTLHAEARLRYIGELEIADSVRTRANASIFALRNQCETDKLERRVAR